MGVVDGEHDASAGRLLLQQVERPAQDAGGGEALGLLGGEHLHQPPNGSAAVVALAAMDQIANRSVGNAFTPSRSNRLLPMPALPLKKSPGQPYRSPPRAGG